MNVSRTGLNFDHGDQALEDTRDKFDIHMSVHRKYNSKLQPTRCDAYCLFTSTDALRVLGGSSAHH